MKRWTLLSIRFILGLVFLAAGLSKLGDPLRVIASIYSYQIPIPDFLASSIAHGLPWLEILLGLLLLSGLFLRVSASLAAGLLFVFLILTAQAWWRDLPIDCGCIDLSALHPALAFLSTPFFSTLRNFLLLALAATLFRMAPSRPVENIVNSP